MESSVSNFSGNNNIAELGAEAVWDNFTTFCKLSSIEVTAVELDVRTATVSTNMMFFTRILRQRKDILVITMSRNQFAAQLPRSSKGTLVKSDAVTSMMLSEQTDRRRAPNMRRERMSQNPWNFKKMRVITRLNCWLPDRMSGERGF